MDDRETSNHPDPSGTPKMSVIDGGKDKSPTGAHKGKKHQRSAPDPETGLTDKQEAFVQAIMGGKNYTDAYREAYNAAGMADGTIWNVSSTLAANPKVQMRLTALRAAKEAERRAIEVSRPEYVLRQLQAIADNPDEPTAARVRALELMGKTVAMFTDRTETEDKTDRSADEIEAAIKAKLGLA